MKKEKALLNYVRFPIPKKIEYFRGIIKNMAGNPNFLNAKAQLVEAAKAVDLLEADYQDSRDGSKKAFASMRETNKAAENVFRILANYVNQVGYGNRSVLLSSGFELSKQPVYAAKQVLKAQKGSNTGTIKLRRKAVADAKAYLWQMYQGNVPPTEQEWVQAGVSTQATFQINDLNMAHKYWFRVAPVGIKGVADFCNPVMCIVQ